MRKGNKHTGVITLFGLVLAQSITILSVSYLGDWAGIGVLISYLFSLFLVANVELNAKKDTHCKECDMED